MVEDVRKAIEKVVLKACEGLRQGNASAIAAIYTEDAVILPPNSEMIRGRQGIEKFWKAAMQMGVKDAVFPILELSGTDEIVHTIGNYTIKIQPKGPKTHRTQRKIHHHLETYGLWLEGASGHLE